MPDYQTILEQIRELVADVLAVPAEAVPIDEPFDRLGLASRDAVLLSGDLQDWLRRDLPPSLLYEHPTPARLAAFLAEGEGGVVRAVEPGVRARESADHGNALAFDDFEEGRV